MRDYSNLPEGSWELIEQYIYKCKLDNTYHFADEAYQFNGPYKTLNECRIALRDYIAHL